MCLRKRGQMGKHAKGERPKKFDPKKDLPPVTKGRTRVILRDDEPVKKSKKELKKEAEQREANNRAASGDYDNLRKRRQ